MMPMISMMPRSPNRVSAALQVSIRHFLVTIERLGETVRRRLVILQPTGAFSTCDIRRDCRIKTGFDRKRIVCVPLVLRGPMAGGDEDCKFAQSRRQRRIPTQI